MTPLESDGEARSPSLRCVNCRFWSHLKCLGQNVTIFVFSGMLSGVRAVHTEIFKTCRDVFFRVVSFRGQLKLEPHPHWFPFRGFIFIFRRAPPSLLYGSSPRAESLLRLGAPLERLKKNYEPL